jgi:hypothetical protein
MDDRRSIPKPQLLWELFMRLVQGGADDNDKSFFRSSDKVVVVVKSPRQV